MTAPGFRMEACRLMAWLALVVLPAALLSGCQSKEPPLSPGAAAFKKEVKDCLAALQVPLLEPVSQKNLPAINETLKKIEPQAIKLCRMCPFRIAVLDHEGYTVAVYPQKEDALANFSHYEVVIQVLKSRRTSQQRLFLQDGSQIYVICAPLLKEDQVLGLLVLAVNAEEAHKRWDMTAAEFLGMDFNR